jgi:hypothetical protein
MCGLLLSAFICWQIRMIHAFTKTCLTIPSSIWRGILDITLSDIFVSDLRQVGGLLRVLRFPPPKKLTATIWLTELLLKVALNTITLTLSSSLFTFWLFNYHQYMFCFVIWFDFSLLTVLYLYFNLCSVWTLAFCFYLLANSYDTRFY